MQKGQVCDSRGRGGVGGGTCLRYTSLHRTWSLSHTHALRDPLRPPQRGAVCSRPRRLRLVKCCLSGLPSASPQPHRLNLLERLFTQMNLHALPIVPLLKLLGPGSWLLQLTPAKMPLFSQRNEMRLESRESWWNG